MDNFKTNLRWNCEINPVILKTISSENEKQAWAELYQAQAGKSSVRVMKKEWPIHKQVSKLGKSLKEVKIKLWKSWNSNLWASHEQVMD